MTGDDLTAPPFIVVDGHCPRCHQPISLTVGVIDRHDITNQLGAPPCWASGQHISTAVEDAAVRWTLDAVLNARRSLPLTRRPAQLEVSPTARDHLLRAWTDPTVQGALSTDLDRLFGIPIEESHDLAPGWWRLLDSDGAVIRRGILKVGTHHG